MTLSRQLTQTGGTPPVVGGQRPEQQSPREPGVGLVMVLVLVVVVVVVVVLSVVTVVFGLRRNG